MTISMCGGTVGKRDIRKSTAARIYRGPSPKIKIELVIPDGLVDAAVDAILQSASTGKIGDGKIFLSRVDQAIRIRNQEREFRLSSVLFGKAEILSKQSSQREQKIKRTANGKRGIGSI